MKNLIRLVRAKQWIKNVLIVAAPIGAAVEFTQQDIYILMKAFLAFSFVASVVYIFNDYRDRLVDSKHPTKRNRPLASGKISTVNAGFVALILITLGFTISIQVSKEASIYLLTYFLLNIAYSWKLKNISILEIVIVASGYSFRIIYGAEIFNLPVSKWLMVFVFTFAFGIVTSKRKAEYDAKDRDSTDRRKVLAEYSSNGLQSMTILSFSTSFTSYSFWIFEKNVKFELIPLACEVLALLIFSKLVLDSDQGKLESPEKLISVNPISSVLFLFALLNLLVIYI